MFLTRRKIKNKQRQLKQRAKTKNIPFNLSLSFLKMLYENQSIACPTCGTFFDNTVGTKHYPTIDRIDSDGGYTKDNVRIICQKCNTDTLNYKGKFYKEKQSETLSKEIGEIISFLKEETGSPGRTGEKITLDALVFYRDHVIKENKWKSFPKWFFQRLTKPFRANFLENPEGFMATLFSFRQRFQSLMHFFRTLFKTKTNSNNCSLKQIKKDI